MTPQPSATAVDGSTGSVFCPYTATSNNYDATRKPLGISATLGAFAHAGSSVPLHKQRFLDVGGGTGSFMKEVHRHFGQCALFEYDGGMLKKARGARERTLLAAHRTLPAVRPDRARAWVCAG